MADQMPWAQLVSLTDVDSDPVLVKNEIFSFGRHKNCDMCFAGNKMVSSNHCRIEREDGQVWLYDSSTNGTLVNLHHKIHKHKRELKHGDEIYIIYKKNEPDVNVGFVFQDLAKLVEEDCSDQTLEYSSELDQTQEVEQDWDIEESEIIDKETEDKPAAKKRKLDENENTSKDMAKDTSKEADKKDEPPPKVSKVPSLNTAAAREGWGAGAKKAVEAETSSNPYEETLVCMICQDVFHDCVSLQPCMHSFCAGCYSDWMVRSQECPTCRKKVIRISKNHLVNNMVEAYLKQHPDKARSEEDIKELNEKNKIKDNMDFSRVVMLSDDDNDDDDDDEVDDNQDDDVNAAPVVQARYNIFSSDSSSDEDTGNTPSSGGLFGTGGTRVMVYKTVCRTCPEYRGQIDHPAPFVPLAGQLVNSLQTGSNDDPGEGTSSGATATTRSLPDVKVMADAPGYVCDENQNHILCQCCLEPMPDLRTHFREDGTDPDHRPMQCKLCDRTFCHAFWGCRKNSCSGCIGKFKDLTFDPIIWRTLILGNQTESAILKKYIDSLGMSTRDLLQTCCARLDANRYKFVAAVFNLSRITSNSSVCYACGQRLFSDLAVQYRMDIPEDQLPQDVAGRPDCYWGRNCRTQAKIHHAQRYNHMCDQTRFAP